jgi:hypothetical protein
MSATWWRRATVAKHMPVPSEPLLDRLWSRYVVDVKHAQTFARLHEGAFTNDHVAFRTLAGPAGIKMIEGVFAKRGWKIGGAYEFSDTHLRAIHMTRPGYPRIFISELDATKLPGDAQAALAKLPSDPPPKADDDDALADWFKPPPPPSARDLDVVGKVSQYGAWLLAFGRRVNHFTGSVDDIEAWQTKLVDAGVPMKKDIEGDRGSKLRQSATEAARVDVTLDDGSKRALPYAYFEIAQRDAGFDGFLGPQARQLFDMTAGAPIVRANQRRYERKDALLHVELSYGNLRVPVKTRDISVGGVFLHLPDESKPEANTALQMRIELPDSWVEATGTVVYRTALGVAVEFTWWDGEDTSRATLARYLASMG